MPDLWPFDFEVIVNNSVEIPESDGKTFNSYNQPSINESGLVVFRARSQGGNGQPATGIFTGDVDGGDIEALALRGGPVPDPNNTYPDPNDMGILGSFTEFPSFPRIDQQSNTVAFRGQSRPVWEYPVENGDVVEGFNAEASDEDEEDTTLAGTSGVYTNPEGPLITGMSQLGLVDEFGFFSVPGSAPSGTPFDQFPGAPSPTGDFVVTKGNWTDSASDGQTGIYFRDLVAGGGQSPVRFIADSNTEIPGSATEFGSTAPPSAADGKVVFLGVDNEEAPSEGGIYLADLEGNDPSALTPLVELGGLEDLTDGEGLARIEEILSFDGSSVAYWGSWGDESFTQLISCPADGNPDRLAYCGELSEDGEQGGIGEGYFLRDVSANQGIFVTDLDSGETELVVETGADFDSFVFFNFSGRPPGVGGGEEEDEGDLELARWRESAFMALDGNDLAFKAADLTLLDDEQRAMFPLDDFAGDVYIEEAQGIFFQGLEDSDPLYVVAQSGTDGGLLDPAAQGLPIVSLGLERDGLRNGVLAFAAGMALEEEPLPPPAMGELAVMADVKDEIDTWAGIYTTQVREDSPGGGGPGEPGDGTPPPGGPDLSPPPFVPGEDTNEIIGDEQDNLLEGGPITDLIAGRGGNDTLLGEDGNDYLEGESDDDSLSGGSGNDYLLGGDHFDFLNGNKGDDVLKGGDGADTLRGGMDNDFLNGNAGNDFVAGDLGNDTLRGGKGNDTLNGNAGNDLLYGDLGSDLFLLSKGFDLIADFSIDEGDLIGIVAGQDYSLQQQGNNLRILREQGNTTLANVDLAEFEAAEAFITV